MNRKIRENTKTMKRIIVFLLLMLSGVCAATQTWTTGPGAFSGTAANTWRTYRVRDILHTFRVSGTISRLILGIEWGIGNEPTSVKVYIYRDYGEGYVPRTDLHGSGETYENGIECLFANMTDLTTYNWELDIFNSSDANYVPITVEQGDQLAFYMTTEGHTCYHGTDTTYNGQNCFVRSDQADDGNQTTITTQALTWSARVDADGDRLIDSFTDDVSNDKTAEYPLSLCADSDQPSYVIFRDITIAAGSMFEAQIHKTRGTDITYVRIALPAAYSATPTYYKGYLVTYDGSTWRALQEIAPDSGNPAEDANWTEVTDDTTYPGEVTVDQTGSTYAADIDGGRVEIVPLNEYTTTLEGAFTAVGKKIDLAIWFCIGSNPNGPSMNVLWSVKGFGEGGTTGSGSNDYDVTWRSHACAYNTIDMQKRLANADYSSTTQLVFLDVNCETQFPVGGIVQQPTDGTYHTITAVDGTDNGGDDDGNDDTVVTVTPAASTSFAGERVNVKDLGKHRSYARGACYRWGELAAASGSDTGPRLITFLNDVRVNVPQMYIVRQPVICLGDSAMAGFVTQSNITGDGDIDFLDTDPDTITDDGNGLVAAGFVAGDVITVTDTSHNNTTFTIADVSANGHTITLIDTDSVTAEADTSAILKIGGGVDDWGVTLYIADKFEKPTVQLCAAIGGTRMALGISYAHSIGARYGMNLRNVGGADSPTGDVRTYEGNSFSVPGLHDVCEFVNAIFAMANGPSGNDLKFLVNEYAYTEDYEGTMSLARSHIARMLRVYADIIADIKFDYTLQSTWTFYHWYDNAQTVKRVYAKGNQLVMSELNYRPVGGSEFWDTLANRVNGEKIANGFTALYNQQLRALAHVYQVPMALNCDLMSSRTVIGTDPGDSHVYHGGFVDKYRLDNPGEANPGVNYSDEHLNDVGQEELARLMAEAFDNNEVPDAALVGGLDGGYMGARQRYSGYNRGWKKSDPLTDE